MNEAAGISTLPAVLTSVLVIAGAGLTLIGSFGLVRLSSFYQRVHAPTLGTTLGTACIAIASMIYFWSVGTRPVLHELLILAFITVTTPITLMILVRAALFRDEYENNGAGRPRAIDHDGEPKGRR